ncbi:hypothetical protein [Lactiplantibacillus plajomi]|uniref:Uncharacterized protein n=1 Tax=Lactiplantibacillus plajomi TaxID=1457217 RepID=A0ABV6K286_9LACO|nr:hypothetical protein [Lactiplantibacillus plajomi]
MKCLPIKQAETLLKKVVKQHRPTTLTLLTKKKDRSVTVQVTTVAMKLIERGYLKQDQNFSFEDNAGKHAVQQALKREFPRSHQLYMIKT